MSVRFWQEVQKMPRAVEHARLAVPQNLVMSITTEKKPPLTMKNPPHPGLVVLQECIQPSGLSITDAAAALGVTRNTLSELVNGKRGISPEMAVRLVQGFWRHRARLATATSPVRARTSPPRSHKVETTATGLAESRFI